MTGSTDRRTLTVVGAGVIGMSCAWRAARDGWAVTLVDPAPSGGSSWVAGGMLAPVTEAWPGEEELLELGSESLRGWPAFAAELAADAGRPAGLRTEGTLVVAAAAGDRAELDDLAGYLARIGRGVDRLSARELRRLEPSIGPDVRGGLSVPGDLAVDNRALLGALRAAAPRVGVAFRSAVALRVGPGRVELTPGGQDVRTPVDPPGSGVGGPAACETDVLLGSDTLRDRDALRDSGVRLDSDRAVLESDAVLIAAGAHSAALHPALDGLVRPVKGEILRLRHRAGALPPPSRTVRAVVDGRPVYAVPRDDGGLVVGATQYETGFDTEPTVGGVRDLLRDVERILPGVAEYALLEVAAGLRPGTPDNMPLIGALPDGVLVATGHGRNGMLLAPLTADTVLALLADAPVGPAATAADPRRLSLTTARR